MLKQNIKFNVPMCGYQKENPKGQVKLISFVEPSILVDEKQMISG